MQNNNEELRLRNIVRQAIRIAETKKANKIISEEERLRSIIRVFLNEDDIGDTKDAPYGNTGLNTLNSLFDNILTQLESGYKGLATGKEQRDSFAAHILVNIVNTLAPLRAMDNKAAVSEEIKI
jgi:Mg2+/Co2+ transporter CorC